MAAIATFDPLGLRQSTSVCEDATCPLVTSVGVRWGRWSDGPALAETDATVSRALAGLRRQLGVHVSERVQCVAPFDEHARERRQELTSDDGLVCAFLQGTALIYLRTAAGFTGLLCEAGEWVLLPPGVPHVFDAGVSPDVEFLRLSEGSRGWFPLHTGHPLPPDLPAKDAFVEHLLQALGEEIEDSEG